MKKVLLLLIILIVSCSDLDNDSFKEGRVYVNFTSQFLGATSLEEDSSSARALSLSDWTHLFADKATLVVTHTFSGKVYSIDFNPNTDVTVDFRLPYGKYSFYSETEGDDYSPFLPFLLQGEFVLDSPLIEVDAQVETDYSLITVKEDFVDKVEVDNKSLIHLKDLGYYYLYVKAGRDVTLVITESLFNTQVVRKITTSSGVHYNFIIRVLDGNSLLQILLQPFELIEEEIPLIVYRFPQGSSLTLVAEPNPGFSFSHWKEDGVVIEGTQELSYIMPGKDVSLVAVFTKIN